MGLYANQVCFTKRLKFLKFNFKTRKKEKPSEEIAMEYPLDYTEYWKSTSGRVRVTKSSIFFSKLSDKIYNEKQ